MANIKELQTRIALKYDTYENWTKTDVADQGANLVLLKGEIGICEVPAINADSNVAPTVLFKVGDGTKKFSELPWASAKAADVYGWAKKSEKDFKAWLDTEAKFATDAEVETIKSGLDARITAIEGSVGTGKVAEDITAIKGRLDVIEGESEGSIAKALADAKSYADGLADDYDAAGSAAQALTDAKAYADGKDSAIAEAKKAGTDAASALSAYKAEMTTALAGKQDVIAENTYDAYGAAADVKTYVDGDFKTAIQNYADQAEADAISAANGYTDGKVATLNAKDSELVGLIGDNTTAINNEVTARGQADDAINAKFGDGISSTNTVVSAIATAKSEAIAAAKSETDGQVSALTEKVTKNTNDISTLSDTVSSEVSRVESLVSAEVKAREDADKALDGRLEKVEAFFEGAAEDSEGLNNALDKLVDIQNYLAGEGSGADGLMGQVSANTQGISNLSGRMDTAEDGIEALEGRATAVEGRATTLEGKVADLEAKPFGTYATKSEVEAAQTAADNAQEAADKAQGEVDALEGVVSTLRDEYDVTKALATANDAAISALDSRVGTAEGKITSLETESAKHALKTDVENEFKNYVKTSDYTTDKAATAEAIGNVYTKDEADGKFALASVVSGHTTDIGKNASDITALTDRVGTNETGIADLVALTGGHTTAIEALQELTKDGGEIKTAIATAQSAAETAQAAAEAAQSTADTNAEDIKEIDGRVTAIENDYVKASDLVGDFYVFNCGSSTEVTHVAPKN